MRLLAWNLGHQCREDPIPSSFVPAIRELSPDLLILNEYVHGTSRQDVLRDLNHIGLTSLLVSQRLNGNNQVLMLSRYELVQGSLNGPVSKDQGGESNFLHVLLPRQRIEVVGLRAPAYTGEDLCLYWTNLMALIRNCKARSILFVGDFNTDPDQRRRTAAKHLRALRAEGWSLPSPAGAWSYISPKGNGTRIDHVLASPALQLNRAEYVSAIGTMVLASPRKAERVSDHTPLVVQVALGESAAQPDVQPDVPWAALRAGPRAAG